MVNPIDKPGFPGLRYRIEHSSLGVKNPETGDGVSIWLSGYAVFWGAEVVEKSTVWQPALAVFGVKSRRC